MYRRWPDARQIKAAVRTISGDLLGLNGRMDACARVARCPGLEPHLLTCYMSMVLAFGVYACGSGAARLLPCAYMRLLAEHAVLPALPSAQHGLLRCTRVTLSHAVSLWYSDYAMLKRHQLPPARVRLPVCLSVYQAWSRLGSTKSTRCQ